MTGTPRPELVALGISDPAEAWTELGFTVEDGTVELDGVRLWLGREGHGIVSWALTGVPARDAIDGLTTAVVEPPVGAGGGARAAQHANGAIGLDHVVVTTPDFERTAVALDIAGVPLRRVRTVGEGTAAFRQGFRRLGPTILELVELVGPTAPPRDAQARFWGLVVIVDDLDALARRLGPERCSEPRAAVQPGRAIATLRSTAGLSPALAFMSPE